MHRVYKKVVFAVLFVGLFIGGMQVINGWKMDMVTWSSIPVILSAEGLVLGMMYATIYHGMEHEEVAVKPAQQLKPRADARGPLSEERRAA